MVDEATSPDTVTQARRIGLDEIAEERRSGHLCALPAQHTSPAPRRFAIGG